MDFRNDPESQPSEQNQSIRAIRDQLKELGYLHNPLEKFFIGPFPGGGSLFKTNLLLGLMMGLVGGTLLGLFMSLGMVMLNPSLRSYPWDILRLSLYLLLIFWALACGLGLVVGLALSALSGFKRRLFPKGQAMALVAGAMVATFFLAYGILWWQRFAPWASSLSRDILINAAVFLVILVLSLFLGRLTTLASYVLLAQRGFFKELGRQRLTRGALMGFLALFGLLAFVVIMSYSSKGFHGKRNHTPEASFAVKPSGVKVVLLAVDGATYELLTSMIEKAPMAHVKRLIEDGAFGPIEHAASEIPSYWTSVITGMAPDDHGIDSFENPWIHGLKSPIFIQSKRVAFYEVFKDVMPAFKLAHRSPLSVLFRRSKALWDLLSEKGQKVAVVNWWATWPALEIHGSLVSERAYWKLQLQPQLRDSLLEGETYPPQLLMRLKEFLPSLEDHGPWEMAHSMDEFHVLSSLYLMEQRPWSLLTLYLPGVDLLEHALFNQTGKSIDLTLMSQRLTTLEEYYRYLDGVVGKILDKMGPDVAFVMVTGPGLQEKASSQKPSGGALLLWGKPFKKGFSLKESHHYDILPTLLSIMGFPISQELPGRPLEEALEEAFKEEHPLSFVPSYGLRRQEGEASLTWSGDEEMMERLKSLGYVQ